VKGLNMLPQILAMTIGGPDGVDIGIAPFIVGSLPFIVVITLIVMIVWYKLAKKRLEHQQIMAAIEKGTPLSELRPLEKKQKEKNWITNLSAGIGLTLVGIGALTAVLLGTKARGQVNEESGIGFIIGLVFLGIGITRLIRGILQRKYDKALSSENSALNSNQE
jgi:hypothetical protein